jgi:hypothetical protein
MCLLSKIIIHKKHKAMKTTINTLMMVSFLLVMVLTTQAQSKGTPASGQDNTTVSNASRPGQLVDKNNNGVCDNNEARPAGGKGKNYIDKNGDGICDNRQKAGVKNAASGQGNQGYCRGNGRGKGNCCGRGAGFRHRMVGNPGSVQDGK